MNGSLSLGCHTPSPGSFGFFTQGSSGGALVDSRGRLIGITTAVGVSDVGVEGIGFATPIELVERVIDELIATGEIHHAFLGIFGATSFADTAEGASVAVGVEVSTVEPDTGADAGGLLAGDLITAISWQVRGYRKLNGRCAGSACVDRLAAAIKQSQARRAKPRLRFTVERWDERRGLTREERLRCRL